MSQAKTAVEAGKTYTAGEETRTILGPVQLPSYPGIDSAYGYCVDVRRTNGSAYPSCVAFLSKSPLISSVWVLHGATQKTCTIGVIGVASVAASDLAKS